MHNFVISPIGYLENIDSVSSLMRMYTYENEEGKGFFSSIIKIFLTSHMLQKEPSITPGPSD